MFEVEIKEGFVFFDGTTDCCTNLVALEAILDRVAVQIQGCKRRRRVYDGTRTGQVKGFTRPVVGTRTGKYIHYAIAGIAPFGGVIVGQYGNVFHKTYWRVEFHVAQKALVVVHAINEVIGENPVQTIDADVGPFGIPQDSYGDVGQTKQGTGNIPTFNGQALQLVFFYLTRNGGIFSVHAYQGGAGNQNFTN